jgi:hypothetical protein
VVSIPTVFYRVKGNISLVNNLLYDFQINVSYLDPGMGSLIWQGLIGGVLGSIYVARNFLKGLFARFKQKNNEKADK